MENKIRDFLKLIKVNENTISMFLGLGVVAIIAVMIVNYFRETPASLPTIDDSTISQVLDDINYNEASQSAMASDSGELAQAEAVSPTVVPTIKPTKVPPTATPTQIPTPTPTVVPSSTPTLIPTQIPTATVVPEKPTTTPLPTIVPTMTPTPTPSGQIAGGVSTSNDEQVAGANQQKYVVVKGDNLWKIAEKNYKTGYGWVEIAKANNMTSKTVGLIEVGQELNIPQLDKQYPTTVVDQSDSNIASAGTNVDQNITITADNYTVVKGDNLWNIAVAAYGDGFKWTTIYEANKETITTPRYIEVGMNLKLPRS